MSTEKIDLDIVWKRIMAHVGSSFPNNKLRNRLLNLGFEDFIGKDGIPKLSVVLKYGFPFKFNNQLDEGILVLAHFLDRFKKEGGFLEIFAVNRVSKGQEKDLSFWQDAKAKLYLELQNIILLLDKTEFKSSKAKKSEKPPLRRSRVRRVFTFGELSDLAFLSQAGINVLGEQLAADINVGFMFLKSFTGTSKIEPLTNTLIINFHPHQASPKRHNFYELYGFPENPVRNDLPYKERCSARWFTRKEREFALLNDSRLRELVSLFTDNLDDFSEKPKKWEKLGLDKSHAICAFEQNSGEFFNDAMLMMVKAYEGSDISKDMDDPDFIVDRINKTVITRDMIRLQRAMSSFSDAIEIRAVDATSTKNSLKVHQASPVYRDWLRRSLNRVLKSTNKTLHRIYILKDDEDDENKENEYQTLINLLQFYQDYFHYEVSEIGSIVDCHGGEANINEAANAENREWFENRSKILSGKISVHITTSRVIKEFAEEVLSATEYPAILEQIFRNHEDYSGEIKKKKKIYGHHDIAKLDYLYARYKREEFSAPLKSKKPEEKMIYNFLNPRADTGELKFPAFTYRDNVSTSSERQSLFGFQNRGLGASEEGVQVQNRVNLVSISLLQYADTYKDILKKEREDYKELLDNIRSQRNQGSGDVGPTLLDEMLKTRGVFENRLYKYFEPHFEYLNAVLEFMSIKVDFSDNINATSIRQLSPFRECEIPDKTGNLQNRVGTFTENLMEMVRSKLTENREVPRPEKYGLSGVTQTAKTYDVFISYRWVSPIQEWVRDQLYDRLSEAGLKVCLDVKVKGFRSGQIAILEMERAVKESRHTLGVITPEYFEVDRSTIFEGVTARQLDITGIRSTYIPLILRKPNEMPSWMSQLVSIDLTNQNTRSEQWQKLLDDLNAPNREVPAPAPMN